MSGESSTHPPAGLPPGGHAKAVANPVAATVLSAPLANAPVPNFGQVGQARNAPASNAYTGGNPAPIDATLPGKLTNFTGQLDYPVRRNVRVSTEKRKVIANYFEMRIDRNARFCKECNAQGRLHGAVSVDLSPDSFYEYQILGFPASASRASKKRYIETAISQVPFLNANQASFATDDVGTIISWIDLHRFATGTRIQAGDATTGEGAEWRLMDVVDGTTTSNLNFQYLREVDIAGLRAYADTSHQAPAGYDSSPAEYALNTIMKKCISGNHVMHLNDHKFYLRDAFMSLNCGAVHALRAFRGYSYRVKPSMGKILLNISPSMSAFWRPVLVSDILNNQSLALFNNGRRALRNLKVYITYSRGKQGQATGIDDPQSRIKTIRGFGRQCNMQTFQIQRTNAQGQVTTTPTTVAAYQYAQYGRTLVSPNLAAINVGTALNPTWFAPETLRILPDQIYAKTIPERVATAFHRQSCRQPMANRACIENECISNIQLNGQNQLVRCTAITLNPKMLEIPSIRLPYPTIQYSTPPRGKVATEGSGRWDLKDTKFLKQGFQTNSDLRWSLLVGPGIDQAAQNALTTHFQRHVQRTGVCTTARLLGQPISVVNPSEVNLENALRELLTKNAPKVPDIVILFLTRKDQTIYSDFKWLTDKKFVLQSICVTEEKMKPRIDGWHNDNALGQYMANVAMKANLKGAGINHSAPGVSNWLSNTLVIGADVTHPGSGALEGSPSVAAMVGSLEASGGRFRGKMELQPGKQEIIGPFENLLTPLLADWYHFHKKLPENILYYRDGVSVSQYAEVMREELPRIKETFEKVAAEKGETAAKFKLTAVIVTKRHSTRFFPAKAADAQNGNNNTKPGTLVDSVVTSPYYSDFYLQSHNAIKGTARPAHYFVLKNEMAMTTEQLENLTHALCHTYVRATLGVSYASPAYYADRLCERGCCYLRKWYNPTQTDRNAYDNKRDAREQAAERARNRPPRTHGQRKTLQELKEEKDDELAVLQSMKNDMHPEIQARWNQTSVDLVKNRKGSEAHHQFWLRTMYWM